MCPLETTPTEWHGGLCDLSERLTANCREVDLASTEEVIPFVHAAVAVEGETAA